MVRYKNRYFLCELIFAERKYEPNFDSPELYNAVKTSVLQNFGDFTMG